MAKLWQQLAKILIQTFRRNTVITLAPAEALSCYADRWAIEAFKNIKQLLGGRQPQTRKGKDPERAAGLSLWLYSIIWLWYLE